MSKIITPECRLSYPYLFEANEDGKYSVELIFEPGTDLSELKVAAQQAIKDKWGDNPPKGLRSPFRDGADRESEAYEGATFIGAKSKTPPGVVQGPNRAQVINKSDVYAGCYVMCQLSVYAYDVDKNKGVTFGLNHVWKIRDGEPFGSRQTAEEAFADVDGVAFGNLDSLM